MNTIGLHASTCVAAAVLGISIAACQQQTASRLDSLPDLNTVKECQKADLGRY